MDEITFSVMRNTEQTEPVLRRLLNTFEQKSGIRVRLQMVMWDTARQEVKQYAIHQRGPDVSAMATTWIADLIAMNALQPLDGLGIGSLGKREDFVEASWKTAESERDGQTYAAPWLVDTYVVHYRRDFLEKAGIEVGPAFESLAQVDETLQRLSQAGIPIPFQAPYLYDRFCSMHTLAAWLWGNNGEFCLPDGKKVLFDRPEALAGIRDYYNLARHLSHAAREQLAANDSNSLFRQGQAAAAFGTLSFMYDWESVPALVRDTWCAAALPAPHFVGGVNLVIWKYCMREKAAMELVRFLNRPEVVLECAQAMLTSPARLSVLDGPAYSQDPVLKVISDSARAGRCYPPVPLWGLIEDRFIEALSAIGANVLQSGSEPSGAMINQTIQATARRLNLTLELH